VSLQDYYRIPAAEDAQQQVLDGHELVAEVLPWRRWEQCCTAAAAAMKQGEPPSPGRRSPASSRGVMDKAEVMPSHWPETRRRFRRSEEALQRTICSMVAEPPWLFQVFLHGLLCLMVKFEVHAGLSQVLRAR
jgi:hypothetical protein